MICARCGGNIYTDFNCDKCNLTYDEMISGIRHYEMKKLLERMNEAITNNEDISDDLMILRDLLKDSSLLIPLVNQANHNSVVTVEDEKHRRFILLFTDLWEYRKHISDIMPMTNPFEVIVDLLDDRIEGFVINIRGECFELNRDFLYKGGFLR